MVCEHLTSLEVAILAAGISVSFRGQAWSENCREWVYFDCVLDLDQIRKDFELAACVENHEHLGTHDGQERGFICRKCQDAIMGIHPRSDSSFPAFPGKRR